MRDIKKQRKDGETDVPKPKTENRKPITILIKLLSL